ncbi:MAG: bifunctional riboflavin kinase/FAD synthetase [Faecousia sp.]
MKEKKIIALGFFDGVHAGHQALLRECRGLARRLGVSAAALTFAAHPDTLVFGKTPGLINTAEDRALLLRRAGMDQVLVLPFDKTVMTMPWQAFFRSLLEERDAAGLVCGHDFCFGNRGEGTAALLQDACKDAGIPCVVVPEQKIDGITISSTYIRTLLEEGQMRQAARFLGHPHMLSGTVLPGRQLGRTLGIPTANLSFPQGVLCPKKGVYACKVRFDGEEHIAVTNIGTRPTVGGTGITVESWLPDFSGDLYGKRLEVEFHEFIRPERRFADLDEMRREIRKNAEQTRLFFREPC